MIKINTKELKKIILSGRHLTETEYKAIVNRSEEFKNIVFRKNRKCLVQS